MNQTSSAELMGAPIEITLSVNRQTFDVTVEPRWTLADALRERLGLTGTHLGCEHGSCGACTVLVDGESTCACLMFAIQAVGRDVTTIEGLADGDELHAVQEAFRSEHGLQCGFCTPGMVMSICSELDENPNPTDEDLRRAIAGNLCRCTGYANIVRAARVAADQLSAPDRVRPSADATNAVNE